MYGWMEHVGVRKRCELSVAWGRELICQGGTCRWGNSNEELIASRFGASITEDSMLEGLGYEGNWG